MYPDTIIRGGTVVTATDSFVADVGIAGGQIVALGKSLGTAPEIIDARYVKYLGDDEAAADGPNSRRLQRIKALYDPANFFRMNQNIVPLA